MKRFVSALFPDFTPCQESVKYNKGSAHDKLKIRAYVHDADLGCGRIGVWSGLRNSGIIFGVRRIRGQSYPCSSNLGLGVS